jgi:hypothetical protein
MTPEHGCGKLRIHAENLCPRPDLNPNYMILLREELALSR